MAVVALSTWWDTQRAATVAADDFCLGVKSATYYGEDVDPDHGGGVACTVLFAERAWETPLEGIEAVTRQGGAVIPKDASGGTITLSLGRAGDYGTLLIGTDCWAIVRIVAADSAYYRVDLARTNIARLGSLRSPKR